MIPANITLTQRKDRKDRQGNSAIRIRTTISRKINYYNTGIAVKPDQWNEETKEVINHPNKASLNTLLRIKVSDFEKRYIESNIADVEFLPTSKSGKKSFHEYWEKKLDALSKKMGEQNIKYKRSYLKKMKTFKPVLYFSQITPELMYEYEQWCRDQGNTENTVWGAVKFVKSIINTALKEGYIKVNPLAGYRSPKYKNPKRDFLTEDEVNKLEAFTLDEHTHPTLRDTTNWFLFACYSGLRYSDCRNFKKENIINDRIIIRTEKTKEDVTIKIHPRLQRVIDRLPETIYTNQKCNHYLKVVAKLCNLKRFTFHKSRHTFSVLFLNKGGSIEALSKLLGHTDLKTTLIYGKISNQRLDDEMTKVWQ